MTEQPRPSGAVFLSYASQDAEAATRICESLRAAGVEVWLDKSELRGGDAWDSQIKKQIRDCAVFVPLISAHTNARSEGYFRREWKQATRRLQDMADDVAFLVPVVVDDTREADARVPEEFFQAHWTWLPGGETPPAFAQHVRQLLGLDPASAPKVKAGATGVIEPSERRQGFVRRRGTPLVRRFGPVLAAGTAAAVGILIAAGIWVWHEGRQPLGANRTGETYERESDTPAAPEKQSVAVLPFVAFSEGKDDRYFAEGLSEEIINTLTTLPELLVTARTSSFYFKGKDAAIPEIASMLGVAHVVEGSVRRSGDRVRITAQLVRASDGFHLWSQTYDRSIKDEFAVQTQIAESVAGAMGVLLDAKQRARMADAGVHNVEAFLAYQRGIELFNRAHNEGPLISLLASANVEFETAIALSPELAQAHFQHADLYAHFLVDEAPGKGAELALPGGIAVEEAAKRLVKDLDAAYRYEKDPEHRRVIKAVRTTVSSDWRSLKAEIGQAYASWDNCRFGLWLDQTAILFGFGEQVYAHDLVGTRCDPLGNNWYRAAESAVWLGRPLEGLQFADRAEALKGRNAYVVHARALANLALGRFAEAETMLADEALRGSDVPEFMRLLEFQVPAAAGRAPDWQHLRRGLEQDPERLLVGAAVFGDRDTANRAAAAIDKMTLGPMILIRIADRCGCGKPFDLEATPRLAHILRESDLPWAPLAPIKYPLKTW